VKTPSSPSSARPLSGPRHPGSPPRRRWPALLAALGAALLALAGCTSSAGGGGPASAASAPAASSPAAASTAAPSAAAPPGASSSGAAAVQNAFVSVIGRVLPSVVEIRTSSGLGSGVVFDDQGDIVTNAHVVGTATRFQVLPSGSASPLSATLVGTYRPDDLAVIKVSGTRNLPPAAFGDSAALRVGDLVLAIGNPLGLASSVTEGIISFNGRTVGEGNGVVLPDTVQTSAPINPGNSGGALVDLNAEVVGIPTLAATDPQLGGGSAPGIGFAIPSNTVKQIASQLVASGKVTNSGRPALGISGATAADATGNPVGVIVTRLEPGGAADKAGIKNGELITSVAGQPTPTLAALQDVLAAQKPGANVPVKVEDESGASRTVNVTLGTLTG
jgi:putative serine protease PepD